MWTSGEAMWGVVASSISSGAQVLSPNAFE